MAKINILPAQVYNRIAAGEVVDRPYSVVKELVENAIDAGATEIEIFIERGGKQLIRVVDNGGGILREDLHAAFMPHATSKIAKASDLENILTLGFRGEAVASIAAVSKMTITSKVKDSPCYSLSCDGGQLGEIEQAAGSDGTDVKVEMLFYNTPVRLGFLKADKAEETDIINFVSRFILGRPEIAFHLYVNGKTALQSFGGGEEEAIACVYGAGVLNNCYRIQADKHGVKIRGYIGNQNFFKPNKTYQSTFLNGRYIINSTISAALSNAYASYAMKRQYPFYVLHIDVPTEIVDVNVHPNKSDVRFSDQRIIYGCVYNVVSAVLDGNSKALDYIVAGDGFAVEQAEETPVETPTKQPKEPTFTYADALREMQKSAPVKTEKPKTDDLPFDVCPSSAMKTHADEHALDFLDRLARDAAKDAVPTTQRLEDVTEPVFAAPQSQEPSQKQGVRGAYADLFVDEPVLALKQDDYSKTSQAKAVDAFEENKRYLEQLEKAAEQNKVDFSTCRYAGKLFNTYLLYERGDEVFVIDQHAAHERLIFNRLRDAMNARKVVSQPMLVPYTLDLNAFEYSFIEDNIEHIRSMGFDIDPFGGRVFKISAVPADLSHINIGKFFADILSDISGLRSIRLENLLKDKLATAACKAAVKGGMDLSEDEAKELFRLMDGDMGLKCPHGRPVVVRLTKTELEKMFKRIV